MKIRWAVPLVILSLALSAAAQQKAKPAADAKKSDHSEMMMHGKDMKRPAFDRSLLEKSLRAWETLDPKTNASKYYIDEPGHVFFDLAPLKYDSWTDYHQGASQFLSNVKSLKFGELKDLKVHDHGDSFVWTTSTLDIELTMKDGKTQKFPIRWTSIWTYLHGGEWKMAHEHVSVPMPE